MQSYYEINVALNGKHLFATAPRSGYTKQEAEKAYSQILPAFPESKGFSVTITYWQCNGRQVKFSHKTHETPAAQMTYKLKVRSGVHTWSVEVPSAQFNTWLSARDARAGHDFQTRLDQLREYTSNILKNSTVIDWEMEEVESLAHA